MATLGNLSKIMKQGKIINESDCATAQNGLSFVRRSIEEANRRLVNGDLSTRSSLTQLEVYAEKILNLIHDFQIEKSESLKLETKPSLPAVVPFNTHLSRKFSINELNLECGRIRSRLSKNTHVTYDLLIKELLSALGMDKVEQLGVKKLRDIEVLDNLMNIERLVHVYLSAFRATRSLGTLFDVGKEIANFARLSSFDELYIGPLVKHPQIVELFDIPTSQMSVHPITTEQVFQYLQELLVAQNGRRIETNDLLDFIATREGARSSKELGIRIVSIGLVISALKASKQHERHSVLSNRDCKRRLKEQCELELSRIWDRLKTGDVESIQRRRYCRLTTWEFLTDLGLSCRKLMEYEEGYKDVEELLERLKRNDYISRLFHLAVCQGRFASSRLLDDSEIIDFLKDFQFGPGIETLINAERRLCMHFKVNHFTELCPKMTFLQFIQTNFPWRSTNLSKVGSENKSFHIKENVLLSINECSFSDKENARKDAIDAIRKCRLMDLIENETRWAHVFEHRLGNLSEFLSKSGDYDPDLLVLETSGSFVKLTRSANLVAALIDERNLVGHIVSLLAIEQNKSSMSVELTDVIVCFLRRSEDAVMSILICLRLLYRSPMCFKLFAQNIFLSALNIVSQCSSADVRQRLLSLAAEPNDLHILDLLGIKSKTQETKLLETEYVPEKGTMKFETKRSVRETLSNVEYDIPARDQIEKIKKEKFCNASSALRGMIGRSLQCLALDLYNSDLHFMFELLQNADDNQYPRGIVPTLEFELTSADLIIRNNEIGFRPRDVDSLCDIGNSSKHSRELIGRKGIGFRSVFKITDKPQIHSGSYHFEFNFNKHGPLGFVMPDWLGEQDCEDERGTRFVLPLKTQISLSNVLSARSLLFLKNISIVRIDDKTRNEIVQFKKEISVNGKLFRLSEHRTGWESKYEDWLVCSGIENDAAIAIPVSTLTDANCDVFAYLPVKSYGLPFIVQADFDVTASRQDIRFSSDRNMRLLNQLSKVFTEKVPAALLEIFTDPRKRAKRLLNLIPNPQSISTPAFMTFALNIIESIRSIPLFCPESDSDILVPFSECAYLKQQSLARVLDRQFVRLKFNRTLLSSDIYGSLTEGQLSALGIRELTVQDLVGCLNGDDEKFGEQLLTIHRGVMSVSIEEETKIVQCLRASEIFPVYKSGCRILSSLDKLTVYFPMEHLNIPKSISKSFPILSHEALIPDKDELECFFTHLGVRKLTLNEIVHEAVSVASSHVQNADALIESVLFIFSDWKTSISTIEGFRGRFQLRTKKKTFVESSLVTFPFGTDDIQDCFPLIELNTIDDSAYNVQSKDISEWRQFLEFIGVSDLIKVSNICSENNRDFACNDFDRLTFQFNGCKVIFDLISRHWSRFKKFLNSEYVDGNRRIETKPSTFSNQLCNSSWIPCSFEGKNFLKKPEEVFLRNVEIENAFGANVPYLSSNLEQPCRDMVSRIRLIDHIDELSIDRVYNAWCKNENLEASPVHMTNFYSIIFQLFSVESLRERYNKIWIPEEESNVLGSSLRISGRFVECSELLSGSRLQLIYPESLCSTFSTVFALTADDHETVQIQTSIRIENVLKMAEAMSRKRQSKVVEHQSMKSSRPSSDVIIPGLVKRLRFNCENQIRDTGRWGEQFVYKNLLHENQADVDNGNVQIVWLNEMKESGRPYDITITRNQKVLYIEVKATADRDCRCYFPISAAEIYHAMDNPGMYDVYRVSGAGGDESNAKLMIIRDLPRKLLKHEVDLFIGV